MFQIPKNHSSKVIILQRKKQRIEIDSSHRRTPMQRERKEFGNIVVREL